MKGFWVNDSSGREERWADDGHRWVAAEPRENGLDLWGYQDDTPAIIHLGNDADEEKLEKLADQFLLGDPETVDARLFLNGTSSTFSRTQMQKLCLDGGGSAHGILGERRAKKIQTRSSDQGPH
jgi:hypothetical protein